MSSKKKSIELDSDQWSLLNWIQNEDKKEANSIKSLLKDASCIYNLDNCTFEFQSKILYIQHDSYAAHRTFQWWLRSRFKSKQNSQRNDTRAWKSTN